jgi:hypothetical protein
VETHDEASLTPSSERQQVADDLERLEVVAPTLRRRISQASGAAPASSGSVSRAPASARHLGTLVHRLLEHRAFDAGNSEHRLRELAVRLSGLIGADGPEQAALLEPALELIDALRRDQRLMARLGRQPAWHEVPLLLREGASVWRGAADAVVRPEGLGVAEVFEFKTGRPQAAHEAQLALYVAAVRAILTDVEVTGTLVYPDVLSGF